MQYKVFTSKACDELENQINAWLIDAEKLGKQVLSFHQNTTLDRKGIPTFTAAIIWHQPPVLTQPVPESAPEEPLKAEPKT